MKIKSHELGCRCSFCSYTKPKESVLVEQRQLTRLDLILYGVITSTIGAVLGVAVYVEVVV